MDNATQALQFPLARASVNAENIARLPPEYREALVRILSVQAYAEHTATHALAVWVPRLTDHRTLRVLALILSDEARHASYLYAVLEGLGIRREEADDIATGKHSGKRSLSLEGPLAIGEPEVEWVDVVLNHCLLDRAGKYMVKNFSESSYGPWAAACEKILVDEYHHEGFGFTELRKLLKEPHDRADMRKRFTRWYAYGLNFFGPPSKSLTLEEFGLKRQSNDVLRASFADEVAEMLVKLDATDLVELSTTQYPFK